MIIEFLVKGSEEKFAEVEIEDELWEVLAKGADERGISYEEYIIEIVMKACEDVDRTEG